MSSTHWSACDQDDWWSDVVNENYIHTEAKS